MGCTGADRRLRASRGCARQMQLLWCGAGKGGWGCWRCALERGFNPCWRGSVPVPTAAQNPSSYNLSGKVECSSFSQGTRRGRGYRDRGTMPSLPLGSLSWNCCSVPPGWWGWGLDGRRVRRRGQKSQGDDLRWQMMARRATERYWRLPGDTGYGRWVALWVPRRGDR